MRARVLPWVVAGVATAVAVAALMMPRRDNAGSAAPVRFRLEPPPGLPFNTAIPGFAFALTRDGQMLAFLAGGDRRLFTRKLGQLDATPLAVTDNIGDMRFSPDGRWLAYKGSTTISKVAVDGSEGQSSKVVDLRSWNGLTWTFGPDIVYASSDTLWRVVGEGVARPFARVDTAHDRFWNNPILMPDGKTVSLRVTLRDGGRATPSIDGRLGFISLDGGARTLTDLDGQNVIGYVDGVLVYGRTGGRIAAVRFDLAARKPLGLPVTLVDNVTYKSTSGVQAVLSDNGTLAYVTGSTSNRADIVDEHGTVLASLPRDRSYSQPTWSPDGQRLALCDRQYGASGGDIWIYDLRSRVMTRLTQSLAANYPEWTADGKRIGFVRRRAYWIAADGSGGVEEVPGTASISRVQQSITFTHDGRYAIVDAASQYNTVAQGYDSLPQAYALPLAGGGSPIPLLPMALPVTRSQVSPNGKWLAYSASVQPGRSEIFITTFPAGGGRLQLTTSGGSELRWSRDGAQLFYRSLKGIDVATLDVSGAMPRVIRSDSLIADPGSLIPTLGGFDLHPDGKRMVLSRSVGEGTRLVVVTNWMTEVLAKLGAK